MRDLLLIRNVRTTEEADAVDVLVASGRVAQIAPQIPPPEDARVEEGGGGVLLAGLVDAHCHLDKTLWGRPWEPHSAGPALTDRIANGENRRAELRLPDCDNIRALATEMVAQGTLLLRTHTDVDLDVGLEGVHAVTAVADELAGLVEIEQVAFPQGGVLGRPGTDKLLAAALEAGVGTIGGIDPAAVERNPNAHLDVVFRLAAEHGARVDIHLHERGTLGAFEMELVADYTRRFGLQGRVALSHAVAIADVDVAYADQIAARLAEVDISLITATVYNTPVLPLVRLRELGVNVASGNDGIRDLWGPYGSGSMLERVCHLAYRSGFRRDEQITWALETATNGGRRALGHEAIVPAAGEVADLLVLPVAGAAEAVVTRPVPSLVIKAGRVVARAGALV